MKIPKWRSNVRINSPLLVRKPTLRFWIYFAAFVILLFLSYATPVSADTDAFGNAPEDVYYLISRDVKEINELLEKAFEFASVSPYDVVNKLAAGSGTYSLAVNIRNASKTMALIVAALLLMVDFFKKSVNFEWSSKWENILIFLVKLIVIKQVVQNADTIMAYLYAGFNSINKSIGTTNIEFLPYGNEIRYIIQYKNTGDGLLERIYSFFWSTDLSKIYYISQDAVNIFYDVTLPASSGGSSYELGTMFSAPSNMGSFTPTLEIIFVWIYFFALRVLAILIFVIFIGRIFELTFYTIFAPLPLSTFASEISHDVAKNFIKNYIAAVLQVAAIAVMFVTFSALNQYVSDADNDWSRVHWIHVTVFLALSVCVMKSGAWAKKICGIG